MKFDRRKLLDRLHEEPDNPLVIRVREFLVREDTRLVSDQVSKVLVSEALRLWTTRLGNISMTGQPLDGAETLVRRLKGLTPQRKLEQFAFVSPKGTGNLFFEGTSPHSFVGGVLVNTRPKIQG